MRKKITKEQWNKIIIFTLIELAIAAVLIAMDLVSKHVAFANLEGQKDISILGGFVSFTAVKNTGASFGMFGSSTVALSIVSLICSVVIVAFMAYSYRYRTPLLRASLTFVFAGAVGNMVDRFLLGFVRDIVQLSIFPWVFNLADTFLTIGVILILIYVLFFYTKEKVRVDKEMGIKPTAEGLVVGAASEGVDVSFEVGAPSANDDESDQTEVTAEQSTEAIVAEDNLDKKNAEKVVINKSANKKPKNNQINKEKPDITAESIEKPIDKTENND